MTLPSEELRKLQTPEQRKLATWVYELTRVPVCGVMLLGVMEAVATEHPGWTWWQVFAESKRRWERSILLSQ